MARRTRSGNHIFGFTSEMMRIMPILSMLLGMAVTSTCRQADEALVPAIA